MSRPIPAEKKSFNIRPVLAVTAAVVVLLTALVLCTHVYIGGRMLPIYAKTADLSGRDLSDLSPLLRCRQLAEVDLTDNPLDLEEIETLQSALPSCRIRWSVPIGEEFFDSDSTAIVLSEVPDFAVLRTELPYFSKLESMTLTDAPLADAAELAADLPSCEITVLTGSSTCTFSSNSTALSLAGIEGLTHADVDRMLTALPQLQTIDLHDCSGTLDAATLARTYPNVQFLSSVSISGMEIETDVTELDLRGITIDDPEALLSVLPCFGRLETLDVRDTGLDLKSLAAIKTALPHAALRWNGTVYGTQVSYDDTTLLLNGIPIHSLDEIELALPLFENMERIEMCGCGVDNDTMAALRDAHPETKIVWTVKVGHWNLRTDITRFATWITRERDGYIVEANNVPNHKSEQLDNLRYCTDLVALDLGHNIIRDISFVSSLKNLRYLILACNKITDITPLETLDKLIYVELFMNPITDLSPLSNMDTLLDLNLGSCRITDFSALYELDGLERLWVTDFYLADKKAERQALEQALPNTEIVWVEVNDFTGYGWRAHDRYYDMREALGFKPYDRNR